MPAACAAQNADDLEPVQEWTLPERAGNDSNLQYPTNFARFQNVQTLVMYFPTNHGADVRCRNPLRAPLESSAILPVDLRCCSGTGDETPLRRLSR